MFSVGDVVRFKSGGPKMTIIEECKKDGKSWATCGWFDRNCMHVWSFHTINVSKENLKAPNEEDD